MSAVTIQPAPGVTLVRNVRIPMQDGTRLAADLYMPASVTDGPRLPVVLEYIPYRKDDVPLRPSDVYGPHAWYHYLPLHGYVMARVDIRGSGASEGVTSDEYTEQEQADGYESVEWLAQQPWCDGNVNMIGGSWGGFTCLQIASLAPPHLKSVIPLFFTDDRYTDDCHYRGGLLRLYYDIGHYGTAMVVRNALPPDPRYCEEWAEIWESHLEGNEPYLLNWLHHQTDGPYWRNGSVRSIADRIKCPVFMFGGWRDGYPNPPLRLYQALQVPRKLIIGPWNHNLPDIADVGPRIDFLHEVVRWLDHWCKGMATGIMEEPPVILFMQHHEDPVVNRTESAGEWRAETGWPPPGASQAIYHLSSGQSLAENEPVQPGADKLAYEPGVGVMGGLWSGGFRFGLPADQRPDEVFAVVYTSARLEHELCVIGNPKLIVHVSSSAPVIGFAASLSDIAPDGASALISKGMLNATRRESMIDPKPLEEGEIYELSFPLDATAWTFPEGHRIRLAIANADWPNVWPTPYLATSWIHHGGVRSSRLILPTVRPTGSANLPALPPSPVKEMPRLSDDPARPVWDVTTDMLTGRKRVVLSDRGSVRIDDSTVKEVAEALTAELDPRNPATASVRGEHTVRFCFPHSMLEASATSVIQATATHLHITIDLQVSQGGRTHFTKHWVDSVERQLL